jgi:hypothetical protein
VLDVLAEADHDVLAEGDERHRFVAVHKVRAAEHGCVADRRMGVQHRLDLRLGRCSPTLDEHLLEPLDENQPAVVAVARH